MVSRQYETIILPEIDKIDITGMLLSKYIDGATYNMEKKVLSVPNEAYDKIRIRDGKGLKDIKRIIEK